MVSINNYFMHIVNLPSNRRAMVAFSFYSKAENNMNEQHAMCEISLYDYNDALYGYNDVNNDACQWL